MQKTVKAEALREGDVLLLPMGNAATITVAPAVGTKFVTFRTEYGACRVALGSEHLILPRETRPVVVPSALGPDVLARALSDADLSDRLRQLAAMPRSFAQAEREAFLTEAARRLDREPTDREHPMVPGYGDR